MFVTHRECSHTGSKTVWLQENTSQYGFQGEYANIALS